MCLSLHIYDFLIVVFKTFNVLFDYRLNCFLPGCNVINFDDVNAISLEFFKNSGYEGMGTKYNPLKNNN